MRHRSCQPVGMGEWWIGLRYCCVCLRSFVTRHVDCLRRQYYIGFRITITASYHTAACGSCCSSNPVSRLSVARRALTYYFTLYLNALVGVGLYDFNFTDISSSLTERFMATGDFSVATQSSHGGNVGDRASDAQTARTKNPEIESLRASLPGHDTCDGVRTVKRQCIVVVQRTTMTDT